MTSGVDSLLGVDLSDTYRLESVLGRGGTGTVYEASHRRVRRTFAVKVMSPALRSDEELLQRFRREAEVTGRLGHPHIVQVIDFNYTDDGLPYLVMERLRGEDLAERLRRRGALPLPEVTELLRQACSAVQAAHDEGVIHRDLKPRNLFLARAEDGRDRVKVLDFGVSKVHGAEVELTANQMVLGTPGYMSPEQALGYTGAVDQRTDVFAMGAILYHVLTGEAPFGAEAKAAALYRVIHDHPAPLTELRPELSESIARVVDWSLHKQRADRCASVAALWESYAQAAGLAPADRELPTVHAAGEVEPDGGDAATSPIDVSDTVVDPPVDGRAGTGSRAVPVMASTRRFAARPTRLRKLGVAAGLLLLIGAGATLSAVGASRMQDTASAGTENATAATAPAPDRTAPDRPRAASVSTNRGANTPVAAPSADAAVPDTAPTSPRAGDAGRPPSAQMDTRKRTAARRDRKAPAPSRSAPARSPSPRGPPAAHPPSRVTPRPARMHVVTLAEGMPLWANVSVDGSPVGQSPVSVELSADKPHRLTVHRAGFRTAVRRIVPEPGERKTVVVELERSDGP